MEEMVCLIVLSTFYLGCLVGCLLFERFVLLSVISTFCRGPLAPVYDVTRPLCECLFSLSRRAIENTTSANSSSLLFFYVVLERKDKKSEFLRAF